MSVDSNKLDLAEFFVKEWTRQKYAERLRHGLFCVTHCDTCTRLTSTDGHTVTAADMSALMIKFQFEFCKQKLKQMAVYQSSLALPVRYKAITATGLNDHATRTQMLISQ